MKTDLFEKKDVPDRKDKRTLKLLEVLGTISGNKELVSALVDFAGIQVPKRSFDSELDAKRYLRGPLVIHQNGWSDTLPDWMPAQAIAERSEIVLGNSPHLVGPTEMAAVMYPAMLEHPVHHDTCELYLWSATHAAAKHYRKDVKEYWKLLGDAQRSVMDKDVIQQGGRLWHDYSQLAWEIRRRVIRAQAEREKQPKFQQAEETKQEPTVITEQMELL